MITINTGALIHQLTRTRTPLDYLKKELAILKDWKEGGDDDWDSDIYELEVFLKNIKVE